VENPQEIQENKGQSSHPNCGDEWEEGGDSIQEFKKIWRRVFNKRIGCYEIYVGDSNYLVATGITEKSDSFLIGTLPLLVKLLHSFCRGASKGEIDRETYEEAKEYIREWRRQQSRSVRAGEGKAIRRADLREHNSSDNKLAGQNGGGCEEDWL
jgi:hypothetical protein